jgi:hypothetical protein
VIEINLGITAVSASLSPARSLTISICCFSASVGFALVQDANS